MRGVLGWILVALMVSGMAQRAYIGNAGNSTLLVVDLAQAKVLDTWGPFAQPWSVAYGGGKVYVAEYVGRPDAPSPAGRVVELDQKGKALRTLKGAHYPMGVAYGEGRVYVASSAVDWTGAVRGKPEVLAYGPTGEEPVWRYPFPGERLGYPQSLLVEGRTLYVATTWGLLAVLDLERGTVAAVFALPGLLNPIRGLAKDGQGGLYLTGSKEGVGRVVHLPKEALAARGESAVDLSAQGRILADGLPDPWGVARVGRALYLVTSTDRVGGSGPGGLWRLNLDSGKVERVLVLPTRYTLGLAVEE
ncbi:PQQ-binding-like beta-propeller repeat protein [Thermus tenuipuniceus]|uniref:PQQ-binding-like beta-propeller repeat protein n=1 Tax=Thermus tenuipuniceus TaxID=2078690 RepID=UPI000FF87815|nr:PQQ-binding-like beta-propeller repeat protein [Thermus tenuipuniceus]